MHLVITWIFVIGIVIIGILFRFIAKFNSGTNHYNFIGFSGGEDAFETDDDDNDDEER